MPPLAPVWMPQSKQGWGGRSRRVSVATAVNTPVITRISTPESGLQLLRHLAPRTAGDGRQGAVWTPSAEACPLRAAVRGPPSGRRCPLGPQSPRSGGCTLHLCQARLDPTRSLLLDLDLDLSAPLAQTVKCLPTMRETWVQFPGSGRSSGEGNGNPLQCSCLENPRDGGAWWLPSRGSHRVGHD